VDSSRKSLRYLLGPGLLPSGGNNGGRDILMQKSKAKVDGQDLPKAKLDCKVFGLDFVILRRPYYSPLSLQNTRSRTCNTIALNIRHAYP